MKTRTLIAGMTFVLSLLVAAAALAGDSLKVGDAAPDFTLPAATKDSILSGGVTLSSHVGKNIVILAFYPADWSGGCTTEMCTFRDNFADLAGLGATVFGISGDYVFSHREWAKSLNLQFTLLSDHFHEVGKAYNSYNPARGFNLRTVYVIDRQGKIAYIDLNYKAASEESFRNLRTAVQSLQ